MKKYAAPVVFINSICLLTTLHSFAGTNSGNSKGSAVGIAKSEQSNDVTMGVASAGAGATVMGIYCHQALGAKPTLEAQAMCFAIGPSLILEGAKNLITAQNRSQSINPISNNDTQLAICVTDPMNSACTQINPNPEPGGDTSTDARDPNKRNPSGSIPRNDVPVITHDMIKRLPGPEGEALSEAIETAKKFGLDMTNPKSIQAFQDKIAKAGPDGGLPPGTTLPPELQAQLEKLNANLNEKLGVSTSDVPLESGGGGSQRFGAKNHSDHQDLDLRALLGGMNKDRDPASIEGLSKNFHGDAVGLASDNIFKQMSRRYQKKIDSRSFLN